MPRVIDADELIKAIDEQLRHMELTFKKRFTTGLRAVYLDIRALVENAPDAERHGHWISHDYDFAPAESTQECSVCHEEQPIYMVDDNYCPNCGAKMDEVEDD